MAQAHIHGWFDIQVDGQNQFEDGIVEICAYPVSLDGLGNLVTDTFESLVSVEVPAMGYSDDIWFGDTRTGEDAEVSKLPEHLQEAYKAVRTLATVVQGTVAGTARYRTGETVFLPEYKFPGEVEARTMDGGYIVNMASSGELAEFGEEELEDYKPELWYS